MYRLIALLALFLVPVPTTPSSLTIRTQVPVEEPVSIPLPHPGSAHIIRGGKYVAYCADDSYGLYLLIVRGEHSSMDLHYLQPGALVMEPKDAQWFLTCISVR